MQEIRNKQDFLAYSPQGIILSIPTDKAEEFLRINRKFEYNGMLFQEGTHCLMKTFEGKSHEVVLYFDKTTGGLMFYDNHTGCTLNILGYVACVESVYNDDFTLNFGSRKNGSFCRTGLHNTYILHFENGTVLSFNVVLENDKIGDKDTTICDIQFTTIRYRNKLGQPLMNPYLEMAQKSIIQRDCESLFV